MLKKIYALLLALALSFSLTACSEEVTNAIVDEVVDVVAQEVVNALTEEDASSEEAPDTPQESVPEETPVQDPEPTEDPVPKEEPAPEEEVAPEETAPIDEDGFYTTKEDVALYIHTYGRLPDNFITKKEAEALGWKSGGLDDYAYGYCIGGNKFGNYEGLLPEKDGRKYTECDIDTMHASKRGAKRIVFSNDGLIYYTDNHYESFTLLYGEE